MRAMLALELLLGQPVAVLTSNFISAAKTGSSTTSKLGLCVSSEWPLPLHEEPHAPICAPSGDGRTAATKPVWNSYVLQLE